MTVKDPPPTQLFKTTVITSSTLLKTLQSGQASTATACFSSAHSVWGGADSKGFKSCLHMAPGQGRPEGLETSLKVFIWSRQQGGFRVARLLTWQLRDPKIHASRKIHAEALSLLGPGFKVTWCHFCCTLEGSAVKGHPRPRGKNVDPPTSQQSAVDITP